MSVWVLLPSLWGWRPSTRRGRTGKLEADWRVVVNQADTAKAMAALKTAGWLLLRFLPGRRFTMRFGWCRGSTSPSPPSLFPAFLPDPGSPSPSVSLLPGCRTGACVGPETGARRMGVGEGKATSDERGSAQTVGRQADRLPGPRTERILHVLSTDVSNERRWSASSGGGANLAFPHSACRLAVWTGAGLAPARANESPWRLASERL